MLDHPAPPSDVRRSLGPLLDEAREQALLARYAETGDRRALAEILTAHTRLLLRLARRHRIGALREEDLAAEGMMGLFEAARRFDARFGVRFSTYATHWARAYMQRYALANRRIVPMPDTRAARRILGRVGRAEHRLTGLLGRAPTDAELAQAVDVSVDDLRWVRDYLRARDTEVSAGRSDGEPSHELADTGDDPESAVVRADEHAVRRAALHRAIAALPQRERSIVERRCLAWEPPTLDVLASEMALSRERVRQLEARGISMLRSALSSAA